jgi:hypothetical protein
MKNILTAILAFFLVVPAARADRKWTNGFEENAFSAATSNGLWYAIDGTIAIVSSANCHSGTYCARANPTTNVGRVRKNLVGAVTSGTFSYEGYYYFATLPNADPILMMTTSNAAGLEMQISFLHSAADVLQLKNAVTSTSQNGTVSLTTGVQYRIEAQVVYADSGGSMVMKLFNADSTTPLETLTISGEDTLATNFSLTYWGLSTTNSTADLYLDDVAINDDAGSVFNSWIGPTKHVMLVPASDVSVTWTKNGAGCTGTGNYDCVDDLPNASGPDDATTYNEDATITNADRMALSNVPAGVPSDADMILLDVLSRYGAAGTGTSTGRSQLWDESGSETDGVSVNMDIGAGVWTTSSTSSHLVMDLGTRTKANLDSFDVGYKGLTGTGNARRISAVWALLEYIEATGGGGTSTLFSGGVTVSGGVTIQ